MWTRPTRPIVLLSLVAGLAAAPRSGALAQEGPWTALVGVQALSVSGSEGWYELRQDVSRRWERGDRLGGALVETGRFGRWDRSLELRGTLHPRRRLYLELRGRWTPDAEILERYQLHAIASEIGRAHV